MHNHTGQTLYLIVQDDGEYGYPLVSSIHTDKVHALACLYDLGAEQHCDAMLCVMLPGMGLQVTHKYRLLYAPTTEPNDGWGKEWWDVARTSRLVELNTPEWWERQ